MLTTHASDRLVESFWRCMALLGMFAFTSAAHAQSTIREVPQSTGPYVWLYAPCRVKPPRDLVAQRVFEGISTRQEFGYLNEFLRELRAEPVERLTPVEAEAFFVLLIAIEYRIAMELEAAEPIGRAVLEAREHGVSIAQRFRDNSFVRCAHLTSETRVMKALGLKVTFSDAQRRKARNDLRAFKESVLRGEARVDMYRDVLQSDVGQAYLDEGFDLLPDTAAAAPLFELGARYVLDAASNPTDERYLGNWRRYEFMLEKLPLAYQVEIVQRLLAHLEKTWGGKSARSSAALEVYTRVLAVAGDASLASKRAKDAISIFQRYLDVMRELRRRQPDDSNHPVNQALAQLLAGDAHRLDGNMRAAADAYQEAARVYESSSDRAKEMLQYQQFPQVLEARRKAVR